MSHVVVGLCALLLGVLIGMILRRPAPDGQSVDAAFRATGSAGEPAVGASGQTDTADEIEGLRARAAEYRALLSKRDAMVAERDRYLAELEGRLRATEAEVMSLRMRSADSAPSAAPQPLFPQNPSMAAGNPIVARSGRGTMPVVPPNRRGTPIGPAARPPAEVDPADMTQEAKASHALLVAPVPEAAAAHDAAHPSSLSADDEAMDSDSTGEPASHAVLVERAPTVVAPASAGERVAADRPVAVADGIVHADIEAEAEAEVDAGVEAPADSEAEPSAEAEVEAEGDVEATVDSEGQAPAEAESQAVDEAVAVEAVAVEAVAVEAVADAEADVGAEQTQAPAPSALTLASGPAEESAPDDLTEIVGVGPKLAGVLAEHGITTFAALAEISPERRSALEVNLGSFRGRIERDDWIGQARVLAARVTVE